MTGRLRDYGLDLDDYLGLLDFQDHRCPICDRRFVPTRTPRIDHDHADGHARGLLCNNCNRLLGALNDDQRLLQRAADYLLAPPATFVFDQPRVHRDHRGEL